MNPTTPRQTLELPDLSAALSRLGYGDFRPGQREAIETLLREDRLLLVAPTGGGKSLCYQLPAAILPGTTVVVSPLIALMHDQVAALETRGVPATYLASTLSPDELTRRERLVLRGRCKLVYVAPERLAYPGFRWVLERIECPLVAVDEAHCISHWGHDFRPEYLQIGEILPLLPRARVLACTATATPVVRDEILQQLGLPPQTPQLVRGFARPNLIFRAAEARGSAERRRKVDEVLHEALGSPGEPRGAAIVYSPTRRAAEEEADRLRQEGWRVEPYHAKIAGPRREATQRAFTARDLDVVVATNAFGMGIDRPDVRCVAHLAPPSSIEAYYQEAGRAGRDGEPAVCLLLTSPGDLPLRRRLIEQNVEGRNPDEETIRHKWSLFLELMRWVEGGSCRHDAILRYFGDDEETLQGCGHCDVCLGLSREDVHDEQTSTIVRKALCGVARLRGRYGINVAGKLLRGEADERLARAGLDQTPTRGALAEFDEPWVMKLLRRCVTAGWIDFSGEDRPTVRVTAEGMDVIHGRRPARLLLPSLTDAPPQPRERGRRRDRARTRGAARSLQGSESRSRVPMEVAPGPALPPQSAPAGSPAGRPNRPGAEFPQDDPLAARIFAALRVFRLQAAREEKVAPFVIASDRTLREIARVRPSDLRELQTIHGIGPAKSGRYGEALLAVVREAVRVHGT